MKKLLLATFLVLGIGVATKSMAQCGGLATNYTDCDVNIIVWYLDGTNTPTASTQFVIANVSLPTNSFDITAFCSTVTCNGLIQFDFIYAGGSTVSVPAGTPVSYCIGTCSTSNYGTCGSTWSGLNAASTNNVITIDP